MDWLIEEIRIRITRYRYVSVMKSAFNNYIRDHEKIIEAAERKRPRQGRRAMEAHVTRAKDVILDFCPSSDDVISKDFSPPFYRSVEKPVDAFE